MSQARTFRVVLAFWLAAWFINAPGVPGFLNNFRDAMEHPIRFAAFPSFLTDPRVGFAIYLGPLACSPALFARRASTLRLLAAPLVGFSLLALLHVETCSDATFLSTFWVSLWLNWLAHNVARDDVAVLRLGRGLAHAIVGLIFLGALIGKLTPEFQSGEAFYGLYFEHGRGFPYPWLREQFGPATYRALATWFSKGAIAAETMLVASPVLPTRFVLVFYVLVMGTMMIARNYNLFSVLGAPLGLMIGAELMWRSERVNDQRRGPRLRGRERRDRATAT